MGVHTFLLKIFCGGAVITARSPGINGGLLTSARSHGLLRQHNMRSPRRRGGGGTHLSVKNILWRSCHYSQITWNQRFFCFLFLSSPLFLSEKFAVGLCIYKLC